MKKLYLLLLVATSFLSLNTLSAGNKDGRILMYARLSGANEVPAVSTKAKGLVTFTLEEDYKTLSVYGVFDSLSGAVTGCHFHSGARGVNGGVVVNLISLVKGNVISGKVTITKDILAAINNFGIYMNVHTAANPGGEIRGQVNVETDLHFAAVMRGANEVPAVTTSGLGLGSFVLNYAYSRLEYRILVTGLSGNISAAHLHFGALGANGPVAYPLSFSGNTLTGFVDVNSAFVDSLFSGKVYVNVHTAANPGGEIRSQLTFSNQVAFDAWAIGANEVPATTSTGKALAIGWMTSSLDSLDYLVVYDSITPTAAHFHIGAAGVNGGVVVGFTPVSGLKAYSARVAIKPDTLAKILRGDIYMNIHTSANPGGEIRGQTNTVVREGLVSNLCGKQEVPALGVTGVGAGLLSIDRNKTLGHAEVQAIGLTGNATAGHIHIGAKGVSGGVVVNLSITGASANGASGIFNIPRTTFADSLTNGLMYYNVHTSANTGGEIRGQIAKDLQSECLPTGTFELNGEALTVKVYPNPLLDALNVAFDSNDAFEAQVVVSDLLGRSLMSKNVDILRGSNQIQMPVHNLSNGVFFVQLRSNNRILFTEKVVKE
ncbi:MAG: CHRD domain-containing protein [Saprospiraceae bacterium]|nr:CHRD domain-containing protein [Saprospiraceae bacterium]